MKGMTPMVVIAILAAITTIVICKRKNINGLIKYLPSIVILVGGIAFCIIMTLTQYNRFIGIVYIVTFLTIMPAIFISLMIIFTFKIAFYFKNKNENKKGKL